MPPADALSTPPGDSKTSPADEARRALATGDRAAIARIVRDLGPMLRGVVRRIPWLVVAAGLILVLMTLMMNAIAIWLRYRLRKSISW